MDKSVRMAADLANRALRPAGASLSLLFMVGFLALGDPYTMNAASAQDDLAKLPDPTRPWRPDVAASALKTHKSETPPTLKLESTIVSGDRRLAVIDGNTVGVGALIEGFRVKEIFNYRVLLEKDGRTLTLKLLDESLVKTTGVGAAAP